MERRIYLDNAATSWPKPPAVIAAVERYMRDNGAAAGRGVYREAMEVQREILATRRSLATLIGATSAEQIVFTQNCTEALNLALFGLARPGMRVLTTELEHNSVLRPLRRLREFHGIDVRYAPVDSQGELDEARFAEELKLGVDLVVLTHGSNVTGSWLDLGRLAPLVKRNGALLIVDAAQTAGVIPLEVSRWGVDCLATSGHKGLLGPLGTGLLYIAPGVEESLTPLRFGGTGTMSDEEDPRLAMPEKYEAGNLNVPGIVGLGAGVNHVLAQGVDHIFAKEQALAQKLSAGLAELPGVRLLRSPGARSLPVVSFEVAGYDAREVAALLESEFHIQARAGVHCAPRIHAALQCPASVRLSIGLGTTDDDIADTLAALREITLA